MESGVLQRKFTMPVSHSRVTQISREILAYLSRNPDAGDTIEGVVQWWLLDQIVSEQTDFVEEALANLVAEGILVESVDAESRSRFRLNPAKRSEIAELLRETNQVRSGGTEMPLRIKNRSRRLLTVELNTRESTHLAPGEVSRPPTPKRARNGARGAPACEDAPPTTRVAAQSLRPSRPFWKRPACERSARARVSNHSAISSKPSSRAVFAKPGYIWVYS